MTGPSDIDEPIFDEALAWQLALEHDDADWDAYTAWLEADPRHRRAFDEVALTERIVSERAGDIAQLRSIQPHANVPSFARKAIRRRWYAGAMAAALALVIGVPMLLRPADTIYATGRGETRSLALGQGISVDLAPASQLVARHGDATKLELARGDAVFTVAHDPGRQLSIKAGDYSVTDIGTTFGVNRSSGTVRVAVAQGYVSVNATGGDSTRVSAGQQFLAAGSSPGQLSTVEAEAVGSWRHGRLVYNGAPLVIVAADIARYSGKDVSVDPEVAGRQFSGVLAIGDGSQLLADLSDIMGVSYRVDGDKVRIGVSPR